MSKNRLIFLGTGSSVGVPVMGCHCHVCQSTEPRSQRLRPSIWMEYRGSRILIDASPDLRQQWIRSRIPGIDHLLLTHAHFDHIGGLEELIPISRMQGQPIQVIAMQETLTSIRTRLSYLFDKDGATFHLIPIQGNAVEIAGTAVKVARFMHKNMRVCAYRFGSLAYLTDIKEVPGEVFTFLEGVETLILGVTRLTGSSVHITLDEGLALAKRLEIPNLYLTHLSHFVDQDVTLPSGVTLAYDGLEILWS